MKKKITYKEAIERIRRGRWKFALDYEIAMLSDNDGWTVAHVAVCFHEFYALKMSDEVAKLKDRDGWIVGEEARWHYRHCKRIRPRPEDLEDGFLYDQEELDGGLGIW